MKLTIDQLKQNAAAMIAFADGLPIQFIADNSDRWTDYLHTHMMPDFANRPFRPKPQPVSRPWSKPEDVPGPVCWIRVPGSDRLYLVSQIFTEGMWFIGLGSLAWHELTAYQYSTDRKTWHPCTVEDAQ